MWRNTMRISFVPYSRAASTKSSSRIDRNRPRTSRASRVHSISDMIMVMAKYTLMIDQSRGTAAESASQSGIVGIARRNSMIRWIIASVIPPRNPESPPSIQPRNMFSVTPTRPMDMDTRVPYIRRENMSRPILSVPSG